MFAEADETTLCASSTCDAAIDEADEAASAMDELAREITNSTVP